MDVLVSIVGSLVAKAAEYVVDPTARQLSYLFKPRTKFLNLRSKVQDLKDARERLQQSVDSANRKGEEIFDDVQRWLTVANEKISDESATRLQEDEEKATRRCFTGFCPDFKSSYLLSKKADKEANVIAQLLTQKDNFDGVSYPFDPKDIDIIRPVKEYEAFESRSGAFDEVMAALEDDTVGIIGVYGMGGVGKTTLVKEVAGQAKKKLSFDEVVFVAVTQTNNKANIQNEVANQLGMELDKDPSEHVRAARLRDRLKKAKKVLVILDDIWEKQEVDTLGIPSADEHKGCKILMTSRKLDVLKTMGSQKNLPIDLLKEDEAWDLFKNMAGHIAERSDLQSTAKKVAQKCAGLPLAITTVAKALKHKENLYEWEDALERLKPSEINYRGISGAVYSAIEMSYNYLEPEEHKYAFLLCSIMGHNAVIEDLMKYCRGLGLFPGLDTIEKVRNRILALVGELKDSSLLLSGSDPKCFDMHDVVRDVAISIASRDHHWLVLGKEDVLEEWPNEDKMSKFSLVRLEDAKVNELPDELECPNLTLFSMHCSVEVPDNVLKGMQRLKVLELAQMNFTSLPSSIGFLKALSTLRLMDCDLKDVIILGELENLEILDLSRSTIAMLPKEIGQLTKLKLLDLSRCFCLGIISPNVLSKLSRLEELYLYGSFVEWGVEGIENSRCNASLIELQHLSRLTTLEVHIPHVEVIPKNNLFFEKMERYKISIGERWHPVHDREMESSRILKLKINQSIHSFDGIYKLLSRKTESLLLNGVEDGPDILYDQIAESFLPLRFIKIKNCNMLRSLFSCFVVERLRQLEKLVVSNCENISTLVLEKEEISRNDILEFSKLRTLKLLNLKRFDGSWYSKNTFQSARWLFDRKVSCPVLEELNLFSVGDVETIWHIDQLPLISFGVQCLTSLTVGRCYKLKYVFTSSMVKSFVHLKTLDVFHCDEMEGVIDGTLAAEYEESSNSISVFPKLEFLELNLLLKLKRFCRATKLIEFPLLKNLRIIECPELDTFAFDTEENKVALPHHLFNEKVVFPGLEELLILEMDNLERLWSGLLIEHSFSKLTSIYLSSCRKLLNVFPLNMLTRLQKLDNLTIENCELVEEIIFRPQSQGEGSNSSSVQSLSPQPVQSDVTKFEFPSLTLLILTSLPNLKSIHHKMHTISCPSLKEMVVNRCDKVEILFANSQETSSQQPLFWVNESSLPILHQLTLQWNAGIKEFIWHCQGQQQRQLLSPYFPNLEVIKLEWYSEQVLPSYLFHLLSLPNLRTLQIRESCFKEMVFHGEEGEPASLLLSQITELCLDDLPELMHLWKEKEGFPNLRILHVESCSRLKFNLVPSSVSFRNLMTLEVKKCDGIIKLITHSTAKSLVQLKEMTIQNCKNIEDIIQGGDDDDDDEISFPQLNRLELEDLPKLESFCSSEKYTFGFTSLQILVVQRCPKMKMFSQGHSSTPMLHKVQLDTRGHEEGWEGSLDCTIRKLFREKYSKIEECENSKEDESKTSISNTQASD